MTSLRYLETWSIEGEQINQIEEWLLQKHVVTPDIYQLTWNVIHLNIFRNLAQISLLFNLQKKKLKAAIYYEIHFLVF